jgi:hypothetical protein
MGVEFPLPSSSRERTVATRSRPSRWLMLSHPCKESADDRAIVLIAY